METKSKTSLGTNNPLITNNSLTTKAMYAFCGIFVTYFIARCIVGIVFNT